MNDGKNNKLIDWEIITKNSLLYMSLFSTNPFKYDMS